MALHIDDITDHIVSHAQTLGVFDYVNSHEPKNAPGNGLGFFTWVDTIKPISEVSGLAAISALVTFNIRLTTNMTQEPQDSIDANLGNALSLVFEAYAGDFTFDGNVMNVDLLGAYSPDGLSVRAGYVDQDGKKYRVYVITLPIVVSDVWSQEA
jgi:hypothetical protein